MQRKHWHLKKKRKKAAAANGEGDMAASQMHVQRKDIQTEWNKCMDNDV